MHYCGGETHKRGTPTQIQNMHTPTRGSSDSQQSNYLQRSVGSHSSASIHTQRRRSLHTQLRGNAFRPPNNQSNGVANCMPLLCTYWRMFMGSHPNPTRLAANFQSSNPTLLLIAWAQGTICPGSRPFLNMTTPDPALGHPRPGLCTRAIRWHQPNNMLSWLHCHRSVALRSDVPVVVCLQACHDIRTAPLVIHQLLCRSLLVRHTSYVIILTPPALISTSSSTP